MPADQPPTQSHETRLLRARQFRIAAVVALALGIIGVGIVCAVALKSGAAPDDATSALDYYKRSAASAEALEGKSLALIDRIERALHDPRVQVAIILVSACSVAGGCWRLAKRMEEQ